jgi:hypothetical protein
MIQVVKAIVWQGGLLIVAFYGAGGFPSAKTIVAITVN